MSFPDFTSGEVWLSLLTLTFLEIVLGVDNIIFISIAANKLNAEEQPKARNIGLLLAMVFRIILLMGISYLIGMQKALFHIDIPGIHAGFSGQSLILIAGGLFLLYKSVGEIHHKLEGDPNDDKVHVSNQGNSKLVNAVIQIALINIVFSFDSILTAIGLTKDISIMMIAVILSILIMMAFAGPVGSFVNKHPTIQMLGLSFLILIGFMLILEGMHLANAEILGSHVTPVPKGYLYFAIAFSLLVEALNMRLMKKEKQKTVQLHGYLEEAERQGLVEKN